MMLLCAWSGESGAGIRDGNVEMLLRIAVNVYKNAGERVDQSIIS